MTMDAREQMLRKRAKKIGIRVRRRGNAFELWNGQGLALSGSIDATLAYVDDRVPRQKTGPPRVRPPASWAPMVDDYLVGLIAAGLSQPTRELRRQHLTQFSREIGIVPTAVTGEDLVEWMGRRTEWAPETRRSQRNTLRSFFLWAYQTKRISVHIADDLPRVRSSAGPPRPAPDEVWMSALAAASPRVALMLRLAAEAGLRRAEVAQVHTRDLISDARGFSLLVHGKGNRKRIIPISNSLAAVIQAGAAVHTPGAPGSGWLFPGDDGGHLSPRRVGTLCSSVMADRWTLHTARHRFATRAYRGSRNLRAVQTLLGHASVATTQRYTAVDDDEIRAAMEAACAPALQ
jgi:integrase